MLRNTKSEGFTERHRATESSRLTIKAAVKDH